VTQRQVKIKKQAGKIVADFMDTISEGDGDHSCNECELDTYLCPHLFERLQNMIADALNAKEAE